MISYHPFMDTYKTTRGLDSHQPQTWTFHSTATVPAVPNGVQRLSNNKAVGDPDHPLPLNSRNETNFRSCQDN